jgi:hypothetical protein
MSLVDDFINSALSQLGKPYLLGSSGPESYDCSGLVYDSAQKAYNIYLPRRSTEQYAIGRSIEKDDLQRGDIVFFDTGWIDRKPNHNGIYMGNGKFVNANSVTNCVSEDDLSSSYWTQTYYGARRFFDAEGRLLAPETSGELIFTDVPPTHPNFAFIQELKEQGVIHGDGGKTAGETTFRPDNTLTRAEALQMVFNYFEIPLVVDSGVQDFPDVPQTSWFYLQIKTAVANGVVQGFPDGTFKPGKAVTRAEAMKIIFTAGKVPLPEGIRNTFIDLPNNDWSKKYILAAKKKSMLLFMGRRIRPHEPIMRGEMCRALVRVLT